MPRHVLTPLCGPDCRYRGLYEGTQTSLSDMAARQATALGRVGRLRSGIVASLKRSFGRQFAEAERQIGQRMSDLEDEVLLAYLGSFLSLASLSTQPEGLEVLRNALVGAGHTLPPGNDLSEWADSIRARSQDSLEDLFAEGSTPVAAVAVATGPTGRVRRSLRRPSASTEPVTVVAATVPAARQGAGARRVPRTDPLVPSPGLDDLFDDDVPDLPLPPEPQVPVSGDPYGDIPLPDEEPYDPYEAPEDTGAAPSATRTPESTQANQEAPVPPSVPQTAPQGAAPVRRRLERRPVEEVSTSSLDDLFADTDPTEPAAETVVPAPAEEAQRELVAPVRKTRVRKSAAAAQPAAGETPAETPSETVSQPTLLAEDEGAAPRPARSRSARKSDAAPAQPTVLGLPLKPELMPAPAPRARSRKAPVTKQVRASALPPDSKLFDVPPEALDGTGNELTDEVRNALLAQVCIPRPVFAADLTAYTGSAEVVAAWETEQRAGNDSPVRFIPPKARHRSRGSLVLPSDYLRTAATEFTRSIWAECMKRYRGAKLYELGVLLHRVNDEVVGQRLGEHTVLLRLNQQRGLVGVVVVTDAALEEDGPTRAALCADVSELLSERLSLVVVLTTNAEALEPMIRALSEEAERRRWSVAMPVIAAKSWEYADDRGSSATLVLGG